MVAGTVFGVITFLLLFGIVSVATVIAFENSNFVG
jgi:hypothetical protein